MMRKRMVVGRVGLWALAAAWWVAAFGVTIYQTKPDCYFGNGGRGVQLVLGLGGSGFAMWALSRRRADWRLPAAITGVLFVAWLLAVFVWLPTLPYYCDG